MQTPRIRSGGLLQAKPCDDVRKPCWGRDQRQTGLALREQGIAGWLCRSLVFPDLVVFCLIESHTQRHTKPSSPCKVHKETSSKLKFQEELRRASTQHSAQAASRSEAAGGKGGRKRGKLQRRKKELQEGFQMGNGVEMKQNKGRRKTQEEEVGSTDDADVTYKVPVPRLCSLC